MTSISRHLFFYCALLTTTFSGPFSSGQDVLVIRKSDGKSSKRTGRILSWKGNTITIQTGSRNRTVDSKDVVTLQTSWPKALQDARKIVANKDYAAAIEMFQKAKQADNRNWVQSVINSELIQAYDAVENYSAAARLFLEIYRDDPDTRFFHLIPLSWSIGELSRPADGLTKRWMDSDNAAAQLMGASWRLSRDSQAENKLETLASGTDKRIAQLALAQLWRTRSLAPTANDVERWKRQLGRMDLQLKPGPLVVLGMAQKKLKMDDAASINLLKIPILYPEKKSLVAFALFQTGTIMDDNTDRGNAITIWRELIQDFPASQYAEFARAKL